MKRTAALAGLIFVLAGCGSSGTSQLTVGAARTFALAGFSPTRFVAGKPTRLSFTIDQPSGKPLTSYKTGSGPHTGVHLIIVRSDLGALIHEHPPIGADGRIGETVTLPTPGRYRVVVDAYPNLSGPLRNFQLFRVITAPGTAPQEGLGPFHRTAVVSGYRFTMTNPPRLKAISPAFLTLDVVRPDGTPATFTPWFGALAHAIFSARAFSARRELRAERRSPASCASECCFPFRARGGSSCSARWTGACSPLRSRWS